MTAGSTVVGLSTHWGTPQKYVEAVRLAFGGTISLDPCSNIWSIVNAQTEWALPEHDGLKNKWDFPTVYVNPPYGLDKERQTRRSEEHTSELQSLMRISYAVFCLKKKKTTKKKLHYTSICTSKQNNSTKIHHN